MKRNSGTFWVFDDAPSALPAWCYCGAVIGVLVFFHWITAVSWLLVFLLLALPAAVLSLILLPFLQGLALALRHRAALSRVRKLRQAARSEALLVAYHQKPEGSVTFAGVMTLKEILGQAPPERHANIRNAIRSLRAGVRFQSQPWPSTATGPALSKAGE